MKQNSGDYSDKGRNYLRNLLSLLKIKICNKLGVTNKKENREIVEITMIKREIMEITVLPLTIVELYYNNICCNKFFDSIFEGNVRT